MQKTTSHILSRTTDVNFQKQVESALARVQVIILWSPGVLSPSSFIFIVPTYLPMVYGVCYLLSIWILKRQAPFTSETLTLMPII
jgi:hypothetical protein